MEGMARHEAAAAPTNAARTTDSNLILPLPEDVVARIKSSATITSLQDGILRLVENSLDAKAQTVSLEVDFPRGNCTVEDDGLGITPQEFREGGGLGKFYHTSKHACVIPVYGSTGTFIASLSALCLLTITSKSHQHFSTNTVTFHQSKAVSRLTPAPITHVLENRRHGTKVTVKNLFGSMPVRVKQRAALSLEPSQLDKQWDELRSSLLSLLIAFGLPITLEMRNMSTSKKVLFVAPKQRKEDLIIGPSPSPRHQLIKSLLSQAGMLTAAEFNSWIPASASSKLLFIKGSISIRPAPTKHIQFLSLGILPLRKSEHALIYDYINKLFSQSRFGCMEETALSEDEMARRAKDDRFKETGMTRKRMIADKGLERWPMFSLSIHLSKTGPLDQDLLTVEAVLGSVLQVLDALVTGWLQAHDFQPRRVRELRQRGLGAACGPGQSLDPALLDRRPSRSVGYAAQGKPALDSNQTSGTALHRPYTGVATFNELSRVKSSYYTVASGAKSGRPSSAPSKPSGEHSFSSVDYRISSSILIEPVTSRDVRSSARIRHWKRTSKTARLPQTTDTDDTCVRQTNEGTELSGSPTDDVIEWIDPITKCNHLLNARTGSVMLQLNKGDDQSSIRHTSADRHVSFHSVQGKRNAPRADRWLDGMIEKWDNPIFCAPSARLTQGFFDLPINGGTTVTSSKQIEQAFGQASRFNASKISKIALRKAKVIGQVDEKFILIAIPGAESRGTLLVAVDQHAADERVKVEELLQELCTCAVDKDGTRQLFPPGLRAGVKTIALDRPIAFSLAENEVDLLVKHAIYFASWGIVYNVTTSASGRVLNVHELPAVVAERCRKDPRVLITLLRGEVWKSKDGGVNAAPKSSRHAAWTSKISGAPAGLLDMIASRACRSAIMFNDKLDLQDCEHLVRNLVACERPFVCAHGRPSMVPLVDLGSSDDRDSDGSLSCLALTSAGCIAAPRQEAVFAVAFQRWQASC